MRIIAGQLGGRLFQAPRGHRTHPMSDKMRGALFAMLGDINELSILDAFAGSGALGFEAISRGAGQVTAIEHDRNAQRAIKDSAAQLNIITNFHLIGARADAWLRTTSDCFDVVLLDPPYDQLQLPLLQLLSERVRPGGCLILSYPGGQTAPEFANFRLETSKQYGDGSLHIYRYLEVAG